MRFTLPALVLAGAVAAAAAYLGLASPVETSSVPSVQVEPATATPYVLTGSPTPIPPSWPAGLHLGDAGAAMLLSCFDANHDERLDAADGPRFVGLDITLLPEEACVNPGSDADFYVGPLPAVSPFSCGAAKEPLLIVPVTAAATNLLDTTHGESLGLIDIANELGRRASDAGVPAQVVASMSAIKGAVPAQTSMEQWLAHYLEGRLDEMPCLRVVLLGHSHGGVTVTSVGASLDRQFSGRLLLVLLDRTTALYDRIAREFPSRARILNYYQLNEGWHGVPLELPNAVDLDQSAEYAPIAPSAGGGGIERVTHRSLDDSPVVQHRVEDAVMAWVEGR